MKTVDSRPGAGVSLRVSPALRLGRAAISVPAGRFRLGSLPFLAILAMVPPLLAPCESALAGSDTWKAAPATGDWNTATNWVGGSVPNGPADVAIYGNSSKTSLSISADTEVNGIVFNAGASAFTITNATAPGFKLTFSGTGITNNSGIAQNFVNGQSGSAFGTIFFRNSATAGSLTVFTNLVTGDDFLGPATTFKDTSTAANATFINQGGLVNSFSGGRTQFFDISSADNGTFTNDGGRVGDARGGSTQFSNTTTAGTGTFTNNGGTVTGAFGGETVFINTSSAGTGTFTTNGGTATVAFGGFTLFYDTSTAANGTFINNGGTVSLAFGGSTIFYNSSTAGNGIFTNNGGTVGGAFGGGTQFNDSSTAGNATLIANGGTGGGGGGSIVFTNDSTGGSATVKVFGNGNLDISGHNAPGVAIDSLEGTGLVFLGARNLTVGGNNQSTVFSGVISDAGGGTAGTGGSFTKTGTGTVTLTGTNTYTGPTRISGGTLLLSGSGSVSNSSITVAGGGTLRDNSIAPIAASLLTMNGDPLHHAVLTGQAIVNGGLALTGIGNVLSPGNSPGTFSFTGAQTWNSFSYLWETHQFTGVTAGSDFDRINISGPLTLTGGAGSYALDIASLMADNTSGNVPNFSETNRTWDILSTSGGIAGFNPANWTLDTSGFVNPFAGSFSLTQVGNDLILNYSTAATPEPATAVVLAAMGLPLLLRRKRPVATANRTSKA